MLERWVLSTKTQEIPVCDVIGTGPDSHAFLPGPTQKQRRIWPGEGSFFPGLGELQESFLRGPEQTDLKTDESKANRRRCQAAPPVSNKCRT